jgi:hypothetical protein
VSHVSSFTLGLDLDLEAFVFQGSERSDAPAAGLGLLQAKTPSGEVMFSRRQESVPGAVEGREAERIEEGMGGG